MLLTWMMNNGAASEKWKFIPTEIQLPFQVPVALKKFGAVWLISGAPEPTLNSAIKEGAFLTVKHLQAIHAAFGYSLPPKGKGSGKGGSIIKQDHAKALVTFLFPTDSPEEQQRMIDAIVGKVISKVKCPEEIIMAVKELGQEGERDFKALHQCALNQEAVEKERKLRESSLEHSEKKHFTPHVLKDFLPDVQGVSCSRNPALSRYQAFYPGTMVL